MEQELGRKKAGRERGILVCKYLKRFACKVDLFFRHVRRSALSGVLELCSRDYFYI